MVCSRSGVRVYAATPRSGPGLLCAAARFVSAMTTLQHKGIYTYLVRIQNLPFHFPCDEIYRPPDQIGRKKHRLFRRQRGERPATRDGRASFGTASPGLRLTSSIGGRSHGRLRLTLHQQAQLRTFNSKRNSTTATAPTKSTSLYRTWNLYR